MFTARYGLDLYI